MLLTAYCTHRDPPPVAFAHRLLSRRDRSEPELEKHLNGFMGFVMDRGRRPMNQMRFHVLGHLDRVRHQLSLEVDEKDLGAFEQWAIAANAIIFFPDSTVRSPNGVVLVGGAAGEAQPGAYVPFLPDSVERKMRTEQKLASLGIRFAKTLPPVVSEFEVELRDPRAIIDRCLALFACAVRAESLAGKEPISVANLKRQNPGGFAALSPKERAFLEAAQPDRQAVVNHAWRYEALAALAWSVAATPELPFPKGICDVPALASTMFNMMHGFSPQMRSTGHLLDELDLSYRLHWATTDARVNGRERPAGIESGVVVERHYAFNWLTCFQHADWDDVTTPT